MIVMSTDPTRDHMELKQGDKLKAKSAEEQLRFLAAVTERIRVQKQPELVVAQITDALGRFFDAARCGFVEVDLEANQWTASPHFRAAGLPSIVGVHSISSFGEQILKELREGHVVVVCDTHSDPRTAAHAAAYTLQKTRSFVCVPLARQARLVAFLALTAETARRWTNDETALLEAVAERAWSALERLRNESALRASEQRLRLAQLYGGVGVWCWDVRAGTLEVEPECERLYGVPPGAIRTYKDWCQRVRPEDLLRIEATRSQALAERKPFHYEFRIRRSSGEECWLMSMGQGEYDADGAVVRVLGVNVDVTEQKRVQISLARASRRQAALSRMADRLHRATSVECVYDAALDAIQDALGCDRVSILLFDAAHVMRFVAARQLSEKYRAAVEGHSPWGPNQSEPQPICIAEVTPPDVPEPLCSVVRGEGIQALAFIPLVVNARLLGKFMVYFNTPHSFSPEEIELSLTMARQLAFAIDRQRAEEALRRERELLQAVVDRIPVMITVYDPATRVLRLNHEFERVVGWSGAEAEGTSLMEQCYPDPAYRERVRQFMQACQEGWMDISMHTRYDDVIETSWANIRLSDQSQVGIGIDITQRKRTEEALRRSADLLERTVADRTARLQEMVNELEGFSYSIAHDLRAPLRALQGYSHFLLEEYHGKLDDQARGYLRRLCASAERMDRLIQDVLSYSQIVRAELPLNVVELDRLVAQVVESYPAIQERQAQIVISAPLPPVLGNQAALTQCFSNLLANAIKFVASGVEPRVRVWAEQGEGSVRVFVQDNGIGIASDQQQKIFGIFQRASQAYEGTGIGLAIVKKAAERMGGSVGVISEPGQGSAFWVELKKPGEDPVNHRADEHN
jgi:PAS domain S-box-containing protein